MASIWSECMYGVREGGGGPLNEDCVASWTYSCRFRASDTARESNAQRLERQQAVLEELRQHSTALGEGIGQDHMLTQVWCYL